MTQNEIFTIVSGKYPDARLADRFGSGEITLERASIAEAVEFLRDDPDLSFRMLVDIVGIDYSAYPGWSGERLGLVYHLKSLEKGHRISLRVNVPEDDAKVPTISHLYKIANWLEREAFDQYGIEFPGHPNLRRILNHHEFEGHPLRKDYPITHRQWLSESDSLMEEMDARLKQKGY